MNSTQDYSIFKEFTSNREVDEKHVKRLMKSIQRRNLLHVRPISVDKEMNVIDGQHRLEAARRMGIPVYFEQSDMSDDDISMLNSNQKNWSAIDYINHYTVKKVAAFSKLSSLISAHPDISISALITLSSIDGTRNLEQLKSGILNVDNIDQAKEVCFFCEELNRKFQKCFVYDSRFPLAIGKALKAENFKMERFVEQIESNPRAFVPCHTKVQYLEMIQEIYNRNLSKNKIILD